VLIRESRLTTACRDGEYGQDYFTLKRVYLEEHGPKKVHMHWRRFAVSNIPTSDSKAFDKWLHDRWVEKDALLEYHAQHGHFPVGGETTSLSKESNGSPATTAHKSTNGSNQDGIWNVPLRPKHPLEVLQIFISLLAVPIVWKFIKFVIWLVSFLI
jgi:lysocardiolipin and lysophospholipid acyltransferase